MNAAAMNAAAVQAVVKHIDGTITRDPSSWENWPGGWPNEISTALIDAVYSARAVYESKYGRGIKPQVAGWSESSGDLRFSLRLLAQDIRDDGPREWAERFGNVQTSPRRPASAPGGPTKAAAILQAADALLEIGIDRADDITEATSPSAARALRSVQGIGIATTNYFLMLLGRPGVKPDRMVRRFLRDATGENWSPKDAQAIVETAARSFGVPPHELDHAIWNHESRESRR